MTVRTRFAPSPTGHVHIGNMRAAIYNWLYARHTGGAFLLRLEDTDRERSTPEAVQAALDAMTWLGLDYDEPAVYQSTRLDAHRAAAEELLRKGLAYREDKGGAGKGECVVFRMPRRDVTFHDEIKGDLTKRADDLKDLVIVRSDGSPVFHLANVLDDIAMGITHVIRGDDHIENTYRHVALFEAFGAPIPKYAHLPMIVNAQGKPYSKRDGDAYVGDFRAKGYLPDALFNFLVLLGWSPGNDREILSRAEMVADFDFDRVLSKSAQFDFKKFQWMNGEYIARLPAAEFAARLRAALVAADTPVDRFDAAYFERVAALLRERVRHWPDAAALAQYFFRDDFPRDPDAVRKRLQKPDVSEKLAALAARFAALPAFTAEVLEAALRAEADARGINPGELIHPARVAVSGLAGGPGLFQLLETLGRERTLARLGNASR